MTKLKPIMHEKQIAELLDVPFREFYETLQDEERYHAFGIGKKRAGKRIIYAPNDQLKHIQQQFLHVLDQYPVHRQAHGFSKGKDFITNASLHVGKNFIFTFDVENFFPSIKQRTVKSYFRSTLNLTNHTSNVLTDLVCHPDGFLPQGAPTSPVMTNLILYRFDQHMEALAKKYKCTYSRYADDITFSTNENVFPSAIAKQNVDENWQVNDNIVKELKDYGLKIHPQKVHMQMPSSKKFVTGVVVNEKLNVNRSYIKQVRAAIYNLQTKKHYKQEVCKVIGQQERHWHFVERTQVLQAIRVLRGQIEHIGNVRGKQDTYYTQLLKAHRALIGIYRYRRIL
ncbi:MAG: reverse transcriptase domain-containing protein [Solibacillus sp.]